MHVCGSLLLYFVCVCVFKPFFCAGHCPNRPATHNHTQSVGHMILYTSNDHFEWFVRVRRRCVCAGHRWPSMDLLLCIAPSARLYDINVQFLFLVKQLLDFRALEHQSRLYIAHCIHAYSSIFELIFSPLLSDYYAASSFSRAFTVFRGSVVCARARM